MKIQIKNFFKFFFFWSNTKEKIVFLLTDWINVEPHKWWWTSVPCQLIFQSLLDQCSVQALVTLVWLKQNMQNNGWEFKIRKKIRIFISLELYFNDGLTFIKSPLHSMKPSLLIIAVISNRQMHRPSRHSVWGFDVSHCSLKKQLSFTDASVLEWEIH